MQTRKTQILIEATIPAAPGPQNLSGCRARTPLPSSLGATGSSLVATNSYFPVLDGCQIDPMPMARRTQMRRVYRRYQTPTRWLGRYWTLDIQWGPNLSNLTLRSHRVVPTRSKVFGLAETGDLDTLRILFESGKASPFDEDPFGYTPLHVRSRP